MFMFTRPGNHHEPPEKKSDDPHDLTKMAVHFESRTMTDFPAMVMIPR